MELEIKTSEVACFRAVYTYRETVEAATELVVPDTMPDLGRVLFTGGVAVIRSKDAVGGKVSVSAGVSACALCVPEDESGVRSLSAAVPIVLERDAPELPEGCFPEVTLDVVSVDARMLNPRKLLFRASVALRVVCWESTGESFCGEVSCSEEKIETLSGECVFRPVIMSGEKTFTLTDEYRVPSLGELLWHGVEIAHTGVRSVGAKLIVNGLARVSLLYLDAESGAVRFSDCETPFSQMLDTPGELSSPDADCVTLLTADYTEAGTLSGGERGVILELHLVTQAVCSDERKCVNVSDCCSPRLDITLDRRERTLPVLRTCETVRETVRENLDLAPAPAEIVRVLCRSGEAVYADGKLRCPVTATVLYKCAEGKLWASAKKLNVTADAAFDGVTAVRAVCSDCSCDGAELRVAVTFEVTTERRDSVPLIVSGECSEADVSALPSLVVLRAENGATLWDIAKEHRSTRDLIREANCLGDEDISGRVLIVPAAR